MATLSFDLGQLAGLLDYPWAHPKVTDPGLRGQLKPLIRHLEKASLDEVQELFTTTFDLSPVTPPYLAFHHHGETYRRGDVMAKLRELCRVHGIDEGGELPDHLGNVLKLVAKAPSDPALRELVRVELLPGLDKLIELAAKEAPDNPYRSLLGASRAALVEILP